jgi:hypothetical protein
VDLSRMAQIHRDSHLHSICLANRAVPVSLPSVIHTVTVYFVRMT